MGRGAGESSSNFAEVPVKGLCFEFANYLSQMMGRTEVFIVYIYFCVLLLALRDYDFFKGDLDLIALK